MYAPLPRMRIWTLAVNQPAKDTRIFLTLDGASLQFCSAAGT